MRFTILYCLLIICSILYHPIMAQKFDWQGHRGARGLLPENSIPAFKKALDLGVTTIELDVVISKDKQVVVSHEPYFSAGICLDADGKEIPKADEQKHNIYQYTYEQIKSFDCGSKGNKNFPEQQKMKVYKPLLTEVFTEMEKYRKEKNLPSFAYNIEIKTETDGDNVFHPEPAEFSDLVYEVIQKHVPFERVNVQSFDFRILQYWHQKYPQVKLAALVSNAKSLESNLESLGFTPQIYSPHFLLILSKEIVEKVHKAGMLLIPWTVNEEGTMKRLKSWGVDGIITDYPDRTKGL
jgi:glycerophosphoryl diester phosphodiesterase